MKKFTKQSSRPSPPRPAPKPVRAWGIIRYGRLFTHAWKDKQSAAYVAEPDATVAEVVIVPLSTYRAMMRKGGKR